MSAPSPNAAANPAPAPAEGPNDPYRDPGLTLCLSGGGFRATLFHLGSLRRLNELGILSTLKVITSVSGGSILNGVLATRWKDLTANEDGVFTNFDAVETEVRRFCMKDLRTRLLLVGRLKPWNWPSLARNLGAVPADWLVPAYDPVMQSARLSELPGAEGPRFVFCATSVQTGACWHFHGGPGARMGDFYTGYYDVGETTVAQAVAASSAFPPGFGGLRLRLTSTPGRVDPWGRERPPSPKIGRNLGGEGGKILLTDGGVYDNLGVEPVWDRSRALMISDAGHPFSSAVKVGQTLAPRLLRAADISAEQVGAVRKRWLVERFRLSGAMANLEKSCPDVAGQREILDALDFRKGAMWTISSLPRSFHPAPRGQYGDRVLGLLDQVRTDLNAFTKGEIGCLLNHGYWLTDASIRANAPDLPRRDAPFAWPEPHWAADAPAEAALADSANRYFFRDLWRYLTHRAA